MKAVRLAVIAAFLALVAAALLAEFVTGRSYEDQFRADIDAPPSLRYPLGTDDLGRDRLIRLLCGIRTSILLAPAAAAVSVALATVTALGGAFGRKPAGAMFDSSIDLFASLPWLFLLVTVRSALPLDATATVTALMTYGVLAVIAWAGPARVIRNALRSMAENQFIVQAHALGVRPSRIYPLHLVPHAWPLMWSQLLVSIPVFIIGEANLGLLGLGVPEPVPSLGGLLRDLETYPYIFDRPWVLAPIAALVLIVGGVQALSTVTREARTL